ncbi:Fic family protein [Fodinicurvata halophila]|uniref:Fic family protein n=1 Tax=Fodinicurvata halophila TaxID=1419723 RepID=A0ABV8UGI1_9PROT
MKRITGRYETALAGSEDVSAFVPFPLPPRDPEIILEDRLSDRLRAAEHALARLDLASDMVPSLDWFIYAFVRKEAVLSSQIEGTQATLVDLLNFEAAEDSSPDEEVEEICNYLEALSYAREQLAQTSGLPISMRLLNEAHLRLMQGAREANKQPGEVRRSQNWIGGSRPGNAVYVPPPPHALPELLGELEKYLHADDALPSLVRIGLAHVQFESIHPYLDGNGRIGRLLIALLLEHWGLLQAPLLYLSLFFKRHREEYYRRLTAVRDEGDWEGWTDFFLDGVATIADEAVGSARDLFAVISADRRHLHSNEGSSLSAVRLFEQLPNHPVITVAAAMKLLQTSKPTASRAIETLVDAGILVEMTGRKRDRSFAYKAYIDRLRIGTELERA